MALSLVQAVAGTRPAVWASPSAIASSPKLHLAPLARRAQLPSGRRPPAPLRAASASSPPAPRPETPRAPSLPRALSALARPAAAACLAAAALALFSPAAFAAVKGAKAAAAADAAASGGLAALARGALDFILHLDVHLGDIIARYGTATYAILFAIVFAETGLVVTPFLPGDSLLFATGALAALGKLRLLPLMAVYVTAATLGDAVNYAIGNFFGSRALDANIIKKEYIARTERFYADYGGKTVVLARFVPIVRTFAPFVAGVGSMPYGSFAVYNVVGAALWTAVCTGAGFIFGNVPAVHDNFSLVVLGIVAVSLLPVVFEVLAARGEGEKEG